MRYTSARFLIWNLLGFVLILGMVSPTYGAAKAVSRVWPMSDEGTAWMIENLPNAEAIGYPVPADAKEFPKDVYAVVEIPAYVELVSNTFGYSSEMPKPKVEDITRDDRPYKRYTFAMLLYKNYDRWASFFTHWLPRPSDEDRKNPGIFAWHFVTPEGPEPEQTRSIQLLPELSVEAGAQPKRLQIRLWQSTIMNVQPDKLPLVLTLLQRSGFNHVPPWETKYETLLQAKVHDYGMKISADQGGHYGWPALGKAVSPDPAYQNRDHEGKPLPGVDMQWIIDQNGQPWKADLDYCRNWAAKLTVISQDLEFGVEWDNGFSPAGIRAFAKKFNLDAEKLTPQIIWRDHRKQWGDFRAEQVLTMVTYLHKAAKEGNPKVRTVHLPGSPYQTTDPDTMSDMIEFGKDSLGRMMYLIFPYPISRMQEGMDVVSPMWYWPGSRQVREAFTYSRAITSRIPVDLIPTFRGQGREFYMNWGDPGEVIRAIGWAAMLGGSKGACYWLGEFSPLQLTWLSRMNRELAKAEDILLDGQPDPADVAITPLPKKTFTIIKGDERQSFPVPDAAATSLLRAFAQENQRLIGLINLDNGLDAYSRICVKGLPKGEYRVYDVTENCLWRPDADHETFTVEQLQKGFITSVPAAFGVRVLQIAPADKITVPDNCVRRNIGEIETAYEKYREPDTEGKVLAQRDGLTVRYDIKNGGKAILVESPTQQVWIRPQTGGILSDWRIKEGNRDVVQFAHLEPGGGSVRDLFWVPAEAHWSGDERNEYELVFAKVHGSKAFVKLRQAKQHPSIGGLILTKTICVPEDGTDIRVTVEVENTSPRPQILFSLWVQQIFLLGPNPSAPQNADQMPEIYMPTDKGVIRAPRKEIVWAKPGAAYLIGNEFWEKDMRNGQVTGDWIAQRNPLTGEAVLCCVETPAVTQFYSWRNSNKLNELSVEWMCPPVELKNDQTWKTVYTLRYLKNVKPEQLENIAKIVAP